MGSRTQSEMVDCKQHVQNIVQHHFERLAVCKYKFNIPECNVNACRESDSDSVRGGRSRRGKDLAGERAHLATDDTDTLAR